MKRGFRFRLSRLSRIRDAQEQAAKAAWAPAQVLADQARAKVEQMIAALVQSRSEQAHMRAAGQLNTALEDATWNLEQVLEQRLVKAKVAAEAEQLRASALHTAWMVQRQECRALERLEEKQLVRHRIDLQASDQEEADDRSGDRHARGKRAERNESS